MRDHGRKTKRYDAQLAIGSAGVNATNGHLLRGSGRAEGLNLKMQRDDKEDGEKF
jgi:hypothetical protein